jgi:hypothetical protein
MGKGFNLKGVEKTVKAGSLPLRQQPLADMLVSVSAFNHLA